MKRCEIKSEICSGEMVVQYKGSRKNDPKFYACGACAVWLRQQYDAKFKQVVHV